MKLAIREYLACLKERDELDAILPDLLSELGLNVLSIPGKGTRQYGVDLAAVGRLNGDRERVYLLSVKAGDLTRNAWDGNELQSLRPSLNEIIDSYIPNRLPRQHKNKPITICLCFGGNIEEQVSEQVKGYIDKNSKEGIVFEIWNGDKLAELILSRFLREELLPEQYRSMLRRSLALISEPDVSFMHFTQLVKYLTAKATQNNNEKIKVLRQLNICLWILFAWCRDANNLECAYLSSELTLLHAFEISKPYLGKKTKKAKEINATFCSILNVYQQVSSQFVEIVIQPHVNKLHALSSAVGSSSHVDVNLKLFDILGRVAMAGIWLHWTCQKTSRVNKELLEKYSLSLKQLIQNNPLLFSPYKDDHAIDITITTYFLALNPSNHEFIHSWLQEMINRIQFNFVTHRNYPSIRDTYHELIRHPLEKSDVYREEVTPASILYPLIATLSALLKFDDIYNQIQGFKQSSLAHCNFQIWYPDDNSESHYYINDDAHGFTLSQVCIEQTKENFLKQIFNECQHSPFKDLSAIKHQQWPIIFTACRHYRIPLPVHFLEAISILDEIDESQKDKTYATSHQVETEFR